ncbi:MAG: AmmeMemoRadiSam system protein B [Anaerolineales bacterium]|nr:AmmeMemoRadiSam system protein B [Anaerolineae bacterium]PWB74824.1 MAG: AmmeMemoRadiSam system protein B [Anaerolineales bacterium]
MDVRPSPIAGRWYEGNAKVLSRSVDEYLENAKLPELEGEVVGVIAPHAGHIYSGAVAGYAFAALRGQTPDLVAVVSPMHHPYHEPLITTSHDAYRTPLGDVPVDKVALNELDVILKSELGFGLSPVSRDPEHSLEIELPFLQRALGSDWKLLPVMVRALDPHVSQGLGRALAQVLRDKKFALVASTDLSHFNNQNTALKYDRFMLEQIEAFDPDAAFDAERAGKGFACGLGAVTSVLWAARGLGADHVKVLRHATSGDVTGDYSSVVGYGAAAILKTKE